MMKINLLTLFVTLIPLTAAATKDDLFSTSHDNVDIPLLPKQVEQYIREHGQAPDDITGKIVGGVEVNPPFKYEFMVNAGGCGASLIAPNVLLSAAHCAGFITRVRIGRHDLRDNSENYETFRIAEEVPHPNYNDNTLDYDYMVMRLDGDSSFDFVALDDGSSIDVTAPAGRDLVVMGWGATSQGGSSSRVLLEAEVDYVDTSECNSKYGSGSITNRMMCAARSNTDSCQGDSGGPIIDKATNKQVGVVSWGFGCADPRYPGVYARVSNQISWIQEYIDLWSTGNSTPPPTSPTGNSTPPPSPSPDNNTPPPTPSPSPGNDCESIAQKNSCNRAYGCSWNIFQNTCLDAKPTKKCRKSNGKKKRCKKIGCKWRNSNAKCVGRWD